MPEKFTLRDLQTVYEIILDRTLESKSFRRRIERANILEPTGETRQDVKRPAQLYRLKENIDTYFFFKKYRGGNLNLAKILIDYSGHKGPGQRGIT